MEYTQEELYDELTISQNKYMICSMCKVEISYSNGGDEDRMQEHFIEKHNLKQKTIDNW